MPWSRLGLNFGHQCAVGFGFGLEFGFGFEFTFDEGVGGSMSRTRHSGEQYNCFPSTGCAQIAQTLSLSQPRSA